jgi:hypothetical protein
MGDKGRVGVRVRSKAGNQISPDDPLTAVVTYIVKQDVTMSNVYSVADAEYGERQRAEGRGQKGKKEGRGQRAEGRRERKKAEGRREKGKDGCRVVSADRSVLTHRATAINYLCQGFVRPAKAQPVTNARLEQSQRQCLDRSIHGHGQDDETG